MKVGSGVRFGAGLIIWMNLFMAFGSIWIFVRMAPAIETIIERNERSLYACEQMLSFLAISSSSEADKDKLQKDFERALERATTNVTEAEEPLAINRISQNYSLAFKGDRKARDLTVSSIRQLSEINRESMVRADHDARQLGYSGAWGIVFMASAIFLLGLIFLRLIHTTLIKPFEEIHSVVKAYHEGDRIRRCRITAAPSDFKFLLSGINDILDDSLSNGRASNLTTKIRETRYP